MEAAQQPIFSKPSRSENPPWRNDVGQDAYDATQPLKVIYDATIIDDQRTNSQPVQADTPPMTASVTPEQHLEHQTLEMSQHLEQWDKELETAQSNCRSILLHNIKKWPLIKNLPGVSSDFPLLVTRVTVTMLATLSTRHLHLCNGFSPVLTSSATIVDANRRCVAHLLE